MTVAAISSKRDYFENGVTVEFPVPFRFLTGALRATRYFPDGTEIELDEGLDFTTAGGDNDDGGVLTLANSVAGAQLSIRRRTAREQVAQYTVSDTFPAASHEGALDRQMMIAQEQDDLQSDLAARALLLPPMPEAFAGRYPMVLANGEWGYSVGSGGEGGAGTNASWSVLAVAEGQSIFDFSAMPGALLDAVLSNPAPPRFLVNGVPVPDEDYSWSLPLLTIGYDDMHVDDVVTLQTAVSFDQGVVDARNAVFAASPGYNSTVGAELKRWVWIEMYGGKPDYNPTTHSYQTDNRGALNRAIAALGGKGGTILFGAGHFGFGGDIPLPDNVTLEGRCRNVGNQNPSLVLMAGALLWIPGGGKGVVLANTGALRQIGVFRQGLTFYQGSSTFSQWTGWGVTQKANTTDHLLEDVFIAGFEWACRPEEIPDEYSGPGAVTYSRFNTKGKVSVDCLRGIWLHNCSDLPIIGLLHAWPFSTVFSPAEPNSAQLKRPGWAILLTGLNDHTMIMNAFNYGYTNSFEVIDGDNTTWISCDADYPYQPGTDSSFGYKSSGAAQETRWIACQAIQRDSGFIVDSSEPNLLSAEAIGCQSWECRTNAYAITRGHAKINGGTTRSSFPGSVGIQTANDPSVFVEYGMHHFANLSKATVNGLPSVPLRDCGGNTYSNMTAPYHFARYQPGIASAATIALNGTDRYYVVTGTTAISTISSPGDYIGFVITLFCPNGLTIKVDGNINTISGSDTAVAAGRAVQFIATSAGWRQL